jgi:hypothetical protein
MEQRGVFPLCGSVTESLGMEAVIAWRRVNDKETWKAEVAQNRVEFEARETRRLADVRAKRKARRGAGTQQFERSRVTASVNQGGSR